MEERSKYEKWLRDLDAKSEARPAHVVERVKADYSTRLKSVMERLTQHASELQEHANNLVAKLRELEAAEQQLVDDQAETELRHQVGELPENEWQSFSKKAEKELAKIKEDQTLIADDLTRIRDMVGVAAGKAPEADDRDDDDTPRRSTDFDELAFLNDVVGQTTPATASKPGSPKPVAEKPKTPASTPQAPAAPRPAATTPVAAAAAAPAQAAPAAPPKKELVLEAPKVDGSIPTKAAEKPLASHVTGNHPIVLRTSGVMEQPKTLKCAECGAMNYPSEWYCERCGAELAAL